MKTLKMRNKLATLDNSPQESINNEYPISHPISWWNYTIPPFILTVISYLFYYPSLHYDFQFDDIINIQKFYNIRHNTLWSLFLIGPRWISYWLNTINYRIGKFNPYSYRLFNVTFHTITGILLFAFVVALLSHLKKPSFFSRYRFAIAFCAAGLFLLHPVQTQTVSYVIQGQLEGMATLFVLLICLTFLVLANAQSLIKKIAVFFLFIFLGCISAGTKEIAIVSPLLTLLIDWFFVAQGSWPEMKKRLWIHCSLMVVVWGMYIYFLKPSFFKNALGLQMQAYNNIGNVLTEQRSDPITPLHFFISQFKVILHYFFMFIWPFSISVEYDWKLVHSFFAPDCILPLTILLIGAWYIGRLLYQNSTSLIGFAALWFIIAIAPRSSIIPSSELLVDYKTYLASIGIFFLLACAIVKAILLFIEYTQKTFTQLPSTPAHYALLTIFFIPVGFLTYQRNKVWSSAEQFWTNIIKNAPMKARAYNNLGVALSEQGRMQESVPLYKKAISMDRYYPDPWNNLAVAYSTLNKLDLAIETMKQALNIHRNYPEGYNNLASFLITKKDYENAEKMLQIALQLRPYYGKAFFNLGKMYMEQGKHEQALDAFKNACMKADLDNLAGFTVLATMAMAMQKYPDAIYAYQKLLEFEPQSYEHAFNLAYAFSLNNQFNEAVQVYRILISRNSHDARSWYNLGECYLRLNNLELGLEALQMARALKFAMPNLDLRIAACLHDMGRMQESYELITQYVNKENIPEELRNTGRALLVELNKQLSKPA